MPGVPRAGITGYGGYPRPMSARGGTIRPGSGWLTGGLAALLVLGGGTGCTAPGGSGGGVPATAGASHSGPVPDRTGPTGSPDPAGCTATSLASLSLEQQAAQLVLIGAPVTDAASVADTVERYHVGGVFLAGRSTLPAATLATAIAALQHASASSGGLGLQIAVDQEGGEVQTLAGPDFPAIPTALRQGQVGTDALRAQVADWARRLHAIGVTLDLAPVADTVPAGTASQNPPIGALDRQYGSDPAAVAGDITTIVTAAQSAGILTTLKHFPGLGRVHTNTDFGTGAVDSVASTRDPYLQPFTAGIRAGTGAVMISLASYPKLDPASIAAFSQPIVTGLLRGQLGFTGLIVSDDLGAAAAVRAVPIGERAVRFVRAGGDMALSVRTSDAKLIIAALVAEAQRSASFRSRVSAAAANVLASKSRAGVLSCP